MMLVNVFKGPYYFIGLLPHERVGYWGYSFWGTIRNEPTASDFVICVLFYCFVFVIVLICFMSYVIRI